VLDLLCEDIAKIEEIAVVVANFHTLTVFVRKYSLLFEAFRSMQKKEYGARAVGLKLFPLARFAYVYLMIKNAILNKKVLRNLTDEPENTTTRKKYGKGKSNKDSKKEFPAFEQAVSSPDGWAKAKAVLLLLEPLSVMLHFMEGDSIPPSFLVPLFVSYWEYVQSPPRDVIDHTSRSTRQAVVDKVQMRWLGDASHVGLRHNLHCFALMVDPYVLSAYKAVCGGPALKRMLSSFQDK